ncbi:NfeD family protein [Mollicutes bacterium LVI A0039]|nr:NfeD family protein [Mollicutes bacterium LVI A0039]
MQTITIIILVMAFILFIMELITKRGIFIWLALGAIISAGSSVFISKPIPLLVIFVVSARLGYHLLKRWYNTKFVKPRDREDKTRKLLLNQTGIVSKEVLKVPFISGKVTIDGEDYVAATRFDPIAVGLEVIVEEIDETKIYVKRK